jgi:hypothetical protein
MTCFSASDLLPSQTESGEHIRSEVAKRREVGGELEYFVLLMYLFACLFVPVAATRERERERRGKRVVVFKRGCPLLR